MPDLPITDPAVAAYAEAHTTPHPDFMRALAEETRRTLPVPEMLSGHHEGRLLEMLVFASGARRVLELGTYSGYSALAMARGLPEGGRIVTCEFSDEHADFAQRHIDASPFADRIEIRRGPALETLETLEGPFELIFIDADKPNYPAYYEAVLLLLRPGGVLLIDNVLWSGAVADPSVNDASVGALRELNERVRNDERVSVALLPIADGLTLVRKR